jgi:glycerol kinase
MKALLYPAQLPPFSVLPKVTDTMSDYGVIDKEILGAEIPICAMAADQQAALCGECCFEPGEAKVTLGTGCFVTINTGKAMASYGGLYPLIAWKGTDKPPIYAMEGLEHTAGIAVDWIQTLGLVDHVEQTALAASSVSNAGGVYFVPAFYGLGPPYWDSHARGCFIGMTASTTRNHLIRAALESLAFRIAEIIHLMRTDLKSIPYLTKIRVDGGVSRNDFVCQAIADLGNIQVERYEDHDATSLGAAFFAGVQCGYWNKYVFGRFDFFTEV